MMSIRGDGLPHWWWMAFVLLWVIGMIVGRKTHNLASPPVLHRAVVWTVLGVAVAAVAYGAISTPSRHWDGAASFDAKVFWLTQSPTLQQPFFATEGVFHHSPGYSLLQPLLIASIERALPGAGRLVLPMFYLLLCGLVATTLRRHRTATWLVTATVLAVGLTPHLLSPISGSVDSGHIELLLLLATTTIAAGFLRGSGGLLAVGIVLAIAAKPEGQLYAAVATGIAFASGSGTLLLAAFLAVLVSFVIWLPVQAELLHNSSPVGTVMVLGVAAATAVLVMLVDAWVRRRAQPHVWRWGLVVGAPIVVLMCLPLLASWLPAERGAFAAYFRQADEVWRNLGNLPAYFVAFLDVGIVKLRIGLALVLPIAIALLAWRRRVRLNDRALMAWVVLGLSMTATPFLLSPEADLQQHLRWSLPRLLLHWVGPLWLLTACWLDTVLAPRISPCDQPVARSS
ncbi:MAG: hypothetical protein VX951_14025 [Planctomycetota bacterium]|nr:hypothetical protein [Planctomycetota bacterium]